MDSNRDLHMDSVLSHYSRSWYDFKGRKYFEVSRVPSHSRLKETEEPPSSYCSLAVPALPGPCMQHSSMQEITDALPWVPPCLLCALSCCHTEEKSSIPHFLKGPKPNVSAETMDAQMNKSYQFSLRLIAFTTVKKWKPNQLQGYRAMGAEGWAKAHKQQQLTPELSLGEDNFCQCSLPQVSRLRALRKESSLQLLKQISIFCLFDRVIINKRSWWKGLTHPKRSKVKLKLPSAPC